MNHISGSKRWIGLLALLLALAGMGLISARAASTGQLNFLPQVHKGYNPAATYDCASIQQAIDNLPGEGGLVIISGTYLCHTAIVIDRDNVELRGEGASTLLQLAAGANSPVLVIGNTSTPPATTRRHIKVSSLTIDGNWSQQAWECWGGACDSGGLTYIRNNAITVRGAEDVLIEAVAVHSARSGGLVTEKVVRRLTVRDFTSYGNFFDGLAAYETEDSLFSGLYLHDNPYAGMSLDIGFNHNLVSDALLADNGKQGVFMRDSRDNLFQGLQIPRQRRAGFVPGAGGPGCQQSGRREHFQRVGCGEFGPGRAAR